MLSDANKRIILCGGRDACMGLFSWVEVNNEMFPKEYSAFSGWQTYDVVEPSMKTLIVEKDGCLYLRWNDFLLNEKYDEKISLGDVGWEPPFKQGKEHLEKIINFTGVMTICNIVKNKFIEFIFKFSDGYLVEVEKVE